MGRQPRGSGFTLVEILIVIAIIGVLAGMIVPITSWARERARETRCMANLKGIGTAVMMYVHNNNDYLPACGPGDNGVYPVWYRAVYTYLENWNFFTCPSKYTSTDDVPERVLTEEETAQLEKEGKSPASVVKCHAVNYGMNHEFIGSEPNQTLLGNTFQLDSMATLSVIFIADGGIFGGEEDMEIGQMEPKNELPDSVKDGALYFTDSKTGKVPVNKPTVSPRHGGKTHCWFLDNHVELIDTKAILSAKRGEDNCLYDGGIAGQ